MSAARFSITPAADPATGTAGYIADVEGVNPAGGVWYVAIGWRLTPYEVASSIRSALARHGRHTAIADNGDTISTRQETHA